MIHKGALNVKPIYIILIGSWKFEDLYLLSLSVAVTILGELNIFEKDIEEKRSPVAGTFCS